MTNRINLFRGLIKPHEMNYLKIGGIGTLLLCMSPHFVMADTGNDAAVTITQQKGNTVTGVITDDTGEPLIGVNVKIKDSTVGKVNLHWKLLLAANWKFLTSGIKPRLLL